MIRQMNGAPNSWLFEERPNRQFRGVQVHASRSGVSDGDDGPRTENWMRNPKNRGRNPDGTPASWGGSCDSIIFEDGTEVIVNPDPANKAPTYGAGFGGAGSWSAGWHYWQVEVAQGVPSDPYTPAQIVALRERCKLLGVPLIRIPFLVQVGEPPVGICTHEDSANGKRLRKSDPGQMFPWDALLTGEQEDDMPDPIFVAPNGQRAQVGVMGKHLIGAGGHFDGLVAAGAKVVNVDQAAFDSIPDVDTLASRRVLEKLPELIAEVIGAGQASSLSLTAADIAAIAEAVADEQYKRQEN